MEKNLKPKDWVLVKNNKDSQWTLAQFSHKELEGKYVVSGGNKWDECIKLEDREFLIGTSKKYDELDGEFFYMKCGNMEYGIFELICIFKFHDMSKETRERYNVKGCFGSYVNAIKLEKSNEKWNLREIKKDSKIKIFSKRFATDEEKQILLDLMHEKGKDWDDGNKKIIDYKPYEPKDGDFITFGVEGHKCIGIFYHFQKHIYTGTITHCDYAVKSPAVLECSYTGWWTCKNIRHSTKKEKRLLLDALHEQGKDWDAKNKKIVDYKW